MRTRRRSPAEHHVDRQRANFVEAPIAARELRADGQLLIVRDGARDRAGSTPRAPSRERSRNDSPL